MLWSWSDLVTALGVADPLASGHLPVVTGVSIDSRTLEPGDLFIALSGDPGQGFRTSPASRGDGHEFVQQAEARGAAAILAHRTVETGVPVLMVEDTMDALWLLARYARGRCSGRVLALTGSSGKTTAKTFLQHLLAAYGSTHASVGSLNNHWGLPLSLMRMPESSHYGILEIGTNHPGEIAPLSRLARPDVALLLNVMPAHIGNFTDLDEIRIEKLSIQKGLHADGVLVLPDDLKAPELPQDCITFGPSPDAGIRWINSHAQDEGNLVRILVDGQALDYKVPFAGRHWTLTSLACLAVVHALGLDLKAAVQRMSSIEIPQGRGSRHTVSGVTIIDDSYNANPASMAYALDNLREGTTRGLKIAILGEMLELGEASEDLHRQLAPHLQGVDQIIMVGEGIKPLARDLERDLESSRSQHLETVAQFAIEAFVAALAPGDVVLVKGSNRVFWTKGFVSDLVSALGKIGDV